MKSLTKLSAAAAIALTTACASVTIDGPEAAISVGSLSAYQPVVTVEGGQVSGIDSDGVTSYKGIPFAAAPVGDLRWRAPQPAPSWDGIRPGDAYGADCMQNYDAVPLPPGSAPAEDCLSVNVWRPSGAAEDLPVLVWIYGGGFLNGSSSRLIYTGTSLANQDVVVVSFNYRLGRFGTFAHPALAEANANDGALANYGFLDQIAAMKWIKRNVASFGGDPSKITIMGESAGGMSVHNLITSPMTQGEDLFRGAIISSGGNGSGIRTETFEGAEKIGVAFAESNGISADDPGALTKLRVLTAETIRGDLSINEIFSDAPRTYSSPFPDGKVSVKIRDAYESGAFNKVPVIIGATSGDFGGHEGGMIKGARELANTFVDQGIPTYYYRFSYIADAAEAPRSAGAIHADDLPYYFDTVDIKYGSATTPTDNAMGRIISTYVANFTKNGDPNGSTLAEWPGYTGAGGTMMDFSLRGEATATPDPWDLSAHSPE